MIKRIFFLVTVLIINANSEERYTPGAGWKPFEESFYVGGYFSLVYEDTSTSGMLKIDEAALMLYGDKDRWSYMAEIELKQPYFKRYGEMENETIQTKLFLERLYTTYRVDEKSEVTVGKFFSKIGFWNTFSINVLRDTTTDPHYIKSLFPHMSTGVLYTRYIDNITLEVTGQFTSGLDHRYDYFKADRHLAASMSIDTPAGELKAGTGWFKEESGRESLYTTLALKKDSKSFSFLTEGAVSKQSYEGGVLYDIYAQGVWHLVSKHDLIARAEKYKDVSEVESNTILVLGYTYRPKYYMALKGEVDMFKKGSPIWLISFSMMF